MNSFLGEVVTKNMWSKGTSGVLHSNLVSHMKCLNAVISSLEGIETYLGMQLWGSKKNDCLTDPC